MKSIQVGATLRDRQSASTREGILDVAMQMLENGADEKFSHEAIAAEAGMSARTVYRHFPDRSQLLQALWIRLREQTRTRFPTRPKEIATLVREVFCEFDLHQPLIRAVLNSAAGTEVRERGGAEGRRSFAESLGPLLRGRSVADRSRIIAVFVAIYSAPFWQLLRDRGGLNGKDAQAAAAWALETLLHGLEREKRKKEDVREER